MKYTLEDKTGTIFFESESNFNVIVGKNGAGKTSLLKSFSDKNILMKVSGVEVSFELQTNVNENLKDTLDSARANHRQYTKNSLDKALDIPLPVDTINSSKHSDYIDDIKKNLNDEKILDKEIILKWNVSEAWSLFTAEPIFVFDDQEYSIKDLPSGVRKIIELYFVVNTNHNRMTSPPYKVIAVDEPDNFLHPKWIKFIVSLLKSFAINDPNILVIFTTHNQEVMFSIGFVPENILYMKSGNIKRFDSILAEETYNDIMTSVFNKPEISWSKISEKINSMFSFDLSRFILSSDENIIIVEGITDQMFFKNKTSKLVFNAFGFHNFVIYITTLVGFGFDRSKISFIMDGDGKLGSPKFYNSKMVDYFKKSGITYFTFKNDIEIDLYDVPKAKNPNEKFELLIKNINLDISTSILPTKNNLLKILG